MRQRFIRAGLLAVLCCVGVTLRTDHAVAQDAKSATLNGTTISRASVVNWTEVIANVWRTEMMPRAYALVADDRCVLIGAPAGVTPKTLPPRVTQCDLLLLTHQHRDSSWNAAAFVKAGVPVRAPKLSEPYLSPEGVAAYWDKSMPRVPVGRFPALLERFWGDWTYLVHPVGIAGLNCDIADGSEWNWRGWTIKAIATPGHSKDHTAYLATRKRERDSSDTTPDRVCFCGDAIARPGTIWSPYSLEWHHQKDEGAVAAALSLRAIAATKPAILLPEHGEPIRDDAVVPALLDTAENVQQLGAAKNFDTYTKARTPLPESRYLAPEQVGTANAQGNPLPWTKLSPHLFLTGNVYALASRNGPVLLMDAYSPNVVDRVRELQRDHGCGPVEVVMISHAHNDHYTGIFALPRRESFQVWTLDRIADVVDDPHRFLAPYVDPRSAKVDRRLRDGEIVRWHEYDLRIHHLPGQTVFGIGVEVMIDGKHCLFTGDNFYHHDQYSGGGGWSGRNRGLPLGYVQSAEKILAMQPQWILAEHGGAFEFSAEDFRRRRDFAKKAVELADRISPRGDHRIDWDPQRIRIEPLISTVSRSKPVTLRVVANNPSSRFIIVSVRAARPDIVAGGSSQFGISSQSEVSVPITLRLNSDVAVGRHVIPIVVSDRNGLDSSDTFAVLEVE